MSIESESINELLHSRLQGLQHENSSLIIAVIALGIVSVVLLLLFFRHRKAYSLLMQKNEQIERHHRENAEIMQILEQKKNEIEQQTLALNEATVELNWQRDNALRLYDEVEQQRKEMTDSIVYAKRIQTALLPEKMAMNEILNDYFVLFKPRDIVSGDFYYVTAKDNKTIVVVADCTGHGVPGAFMSILGMTFLNDIISHNNFQVDEILNHLRAQVISTLRQHNVTMRDGMDMALCAIDWENSRIEFAGANISLFLLRKPQMEDDEGLMEIAADRMPIGLYDTDNKPFTRQVVPLMHGDALYMFSDGYCDQFGGPDLKKFKKKNLKKLLLDIHSKNMTEQGRIIDETIEKWKGDLPQVDDILMMGIKI